VRAAGHLDRLLKRRVSELSAVEQQMLEIAKRCGWPARR